jgi:murein DD-endopeptidase MepM/ murein hydrolase activator NlpD
MRKLLLFLTLLSPLVFAQGEFYTVRPGDSLSTLAQRFGTTAGDLQRLNGLTGHGLQVGQTLKIPGAAVSSFGTLPEGFKAHTLVAGETLAGIAEANGVTETELRAVNPRMPSEGLPPGAVLRIPPPGGQVVVLSSADTLLSVALEHGLSPSELLRANGMTSPSEVQAGQAVFVPGAGSASAAGPAVPTPVIEARPGGSLEQRRAALQAQSRDLLGRAASLLERYEGRPQGFVWPLAVRGQISSLFGHRNISVGGNTFHAGLDVAAPMGTAIVAVQGGTVSRAGWMGAYGYSVFVDHGDGAQTRYAHMSALSVAVGQAVGQGQQLGLVGSTGASTGPHLHFELRFNGRAVDPRPYLP